MAVAVLGIVIALGVVPAAGPASERASAALAAATATVDVAQRVGLGGRTHTWSADVIDFNRDGWKDVMIGRHRFGSSQLFRNRHGHFVPLDGARFFAAEGEHHDRHDCAWADVDRDTLFDVFCSIGANHGRASKRNEMWIQQSDGTFADEADAWGVEDRYGRGRFSTFLRANGDRFPDLFVANVSRPDQQQSEDVLFINRRGNHFARATDSGLEHIAGGKSVQAVDYNVDGREEVVVCAPSGVHLYRNMRHATFADVSEPSGVDRPCEFTQMGDIDRDGRLDLVTITDTRLSISFARGGSFRTVDLSRRIRMGESVGLGDFDGDRWLDVYVVQSTKDHNIPDQLLLSHDRGTRFKRLPMRTTRQGAGDYVTAIDSNRDGRDEFLVLNGAGDVKGPTQLIAARPYSG